jgi:serine/threonine protein kinase
MEYSGVQYTVEQTSIASISQHSDTMENYKVIKALGQGTWGVVHMAEQKGTGRVVAIKKIKSMQANSSTRISLN